MNELYIYKGKLEYSELQDKIKHTLTFDLYVTYFITVL